MACCVSSKNEMGVCFCCFLMSLLSLFSVPLALVAQLNVHLTGDQEVVGSTSVAQLDAPSDWRPGGRGFNPS